MPPGDLASVVSGKANEVAQRFAMELKLMDAVFDLTSCCYERLARFAGRTQNMKMPMPFLPREGVEHDMMVDLTLGPRVIVKLAHVCLQKMSINAPRVQHYISKRSCNSWLRGGKKHTSQWLTSITSQSEDVMGATQTLSNLLRSNEHIQKTMVNDSLLKKFQTLIENKGPHPRLLGLFKATCVVHGKSIVGNQEKVLRNLWVPNERRLRALLQITCASDTPPLLRSETTFLDTRAPPKFLGRSALEANLAKFPAARYGAEILFTQVFVSWKSTDDWHEESDALYFSPEKIGIDKKSLKQGQLVPIELLCWVLEPDRLCEAVTGEEFLPFKDDKRSSTVVSTQPERGADEEIMFKRHLMIAEYLVAQFDLFTAMCQGRSYNCINWLSNTKNTDDGPRGFSYEMLISIAANQFLPYTIRAAVIKFILVLYVDRYPQVNRVGRASIPEKLWVYHDESQELSKEEVRQGKLLEDRGIPAIRLMKRTPPLLKDRNALPIFTIGSHHEFFHEEDEQLCFPSDEKYYLISRVAHDFIESCADSVIHQDLHHNEFLQSVLSSEQLLLSAGFKASVEKLSNLLKPAGAILDGRTDKDTAEEYFDPPKKRFMNPGGGFFEEVLGAKKQIIDMLSSTYELRENYLLGRTLQLFRKWADGPKHFFGMSSSSDPYHVLVNYTKMKAKGKVLPRNHHINVKLLAHFTKLMAGDTKDDAKLLDLVNLTSDDLLSVLADVSLTRPPWLFARVFCYFSGFSMPDPNSYTLIR
jgi:hypothetical protein